MFLVLLILVCTLLAIYLKWNFTYWQRQGYPCEAPKIPFGTLDSVRRRERSLGMAIYDSYCRSQAPVLGIYLLTRPALLVRDAQLARDILSKDFSSFHDRGIYVDEERNPMSGGLFALRGLKWKSLRTKLNPTFTSGKLKAMFGTVDDTGDKMLAHLNTLIPAQGSAEVEIKGVLTTFAIDIIASVIFGLDVNSYSDPTNAFYTVSKKINRPIFWDVIRGTCQFLYPNLEKVFVRLGLLEVAAQEMKEIVHQTVEYREKNNIIRKDMLQLLLQLRNSGQINENDNNWSAETNAGAIKHMSVDMIAAHLFLFYIAGYETTASASAFTIYELSQYPDVLRKAQEDVDAALEKHGELTYDALHDMKYLELCVMETTRKYPGLPILNRQCTHDYTIPGSQKVIKVGTPIIISLLGIHRDEKYFPDPLVYQPERFLEEIKNYDSTAYMPFGVGPRHCIAQRMGRLNVKVAIAKILTNFDIEIRPQVTEIEIDNFGVPIMPKGGVPVRLSKKAKQ